MKVLQTIIPVSSRGNLFICYCLYIIFKWWSTNKPKHLLLVSLSIPNIVKHSLHVCWRLINSVHPGQPLLRKQLSQRSVSGSRNILEQYLFNKVTPRVLTRLIYRSILLYDGHTWKGQKVCFMTQDYRCLKDWWCIILLESDSSLWRLDIIIHKIILYL